MYTTIIFDLDDTLTDNYENVKYAFKSVMNYKNEEYTEEKFLKSSYGKIKNKIKKRYTFRW